MQSLLERQVEPELMLEPEQVLAYANADFSRPHEVIIESFKRVFPTSEISATVLDLGCGPGDISFRFAEAFPKSSIIGIDGSAEMLKFAELRRQTATADVRNRTAFVQTTMPSQQIPNLHYGAIVSNSLLHHLHDPQVLWKTIRQHAQSETLIFIADLFRPCSIAEAQRMVNLYACDEPVVLQRDFFNSLLAAFTLDEIYQQLVENELHYLTIKNISDRHVIIYGEFQKSE